VQLPNRAGMLRVIAGEYEAHHGPAYTFTSIDLWDLRLNQSGLASFVLPEGRTVSVVVLKGTVQVNGGAIAREAQFVLLDRRGGEITLEANSEPLCHEHVRRDQAGDGRLSERPLRRNRRLSALPPVAA
jgi:redox-sensitive bicupin YhaK (pirin superfamily)